MHSHDLRAHCLLRRSSNQAMTYQLVIGGYPLQTMQEHSQMLHVTLLGCHDGMIAEAV